jgi:glyoxylase-like metal-dependent hydrolase (beta-lactamase superfamily II)
MDTQVVLYLIQGERNAIIDTGLSTAPENDIVPALEPLGLNLADIHLILHTHGHVDHTGGDSYMKRAGNAQIFIHRDEASQLNDRKRYFDEFFAPMVERILGKEHIAKEWAQYTESAGAEVAVDGHLKDNDIINLGEGCQLRVLHLPGHTPGSIGFYWEEEGILFSGDALPGLHDDGGGLPILTDLEAYNTSLARLERLPIKYLLLSHDHRGLSSPPFHIKQGEVVKNHLQDCYEVANQIAEAARAVGPPTAGKPIMSIYDQVVARLSPKMGFKPSGEIGMTLFSAMTILFTLYPMRKYQISK